MFVQGFSPWRRCITCLKLKDGAARWRRALSGPLSRRPSHICRTKIWAGFAYSGWAQCALPHKRLADDAPWGIVSEKVKLMVEPGRRQVVADDGSQTFEFLGVPFGSHARLILLYLQTEALRTGSRECLNSAGPCGLGSAKWALPQEARRVRAFVIRRSESAAAS